MRRAFTLIELLVVIAIIAILAAILFPVFAQAKMAAKKTAALGAAKQIAVGLNLYSTDADDMIVPSALYLPTVNNAPQLRMYAPAMCLMQPYVKSYGFWHVPADDHASFADGRTNVNLWDGALRDHYLPLSFNYVAPMRTVEAAGIDANTGIGPNYFTGDITKVRSLTSFDQPSDTIAFVEVWSDGLVGQADGSTLTNCDAYKLAGRTPGFAPTGGDVLPCPGASFTLAKPTKGYAGGTANYVMTDGSAKSLTWGAVRRNDFYRFKVAKPATVFIP